MSAPIVVLIPAHNEADALPDTIASLQVQTIPPDRILVVSDNSTDDTLEVAESHGVEAMETIGNRFRKAGALNQGLATLDRAGLVLVMDADTQLVSTFIETALSELQNPNVGGVGAVFKGTPPSNFIELCTFMEWSRYAEQIHRTGRTFVLSGTAALIRWEALEDVRERFGQWYNTDTITEDSFLTLALKLCGWELRSPVSMQATTEMMPTAAMLFKQRTRWSRGAIANVMDLGLNRVTARYWGQQVMLLLSILLMSLLITLTVVAVAMHGLITPQPFWLGVGAIFAVERVVTVWALPWRYRLFAALIIPELVFAWILMAAHLTAVWQTIRGHAGEWHHLAPTSKEIPNAA